MPYPGPPAAANASSPMKKSRSSVPRFPDKCELAPPPPPKNDGLFPTGGRPDPEPPALDLLAIAVGNTNEGESLPANPGVTCQPGTHRLADGDSLMNVPSFE